MYSRTEFYVQKECFELENVLQFEKKNSENKTKSKKLRCFGPCLHSTVKRKESESDPTRIIIIILRVPLSHSNPSMMTCQATLAPMDFQDVQD